MAVYPISLSKSSVGLAMSCRHHLLVSENVARFPFRTFKDGVPKANFIRDGKSGPIVDVSEWRFRILGITDSTHTIVRVEQAATDHGDYDVVKENCACVSRREIVVNENVLDVHISSA